MADFDYWCLAKLRDNNGEVYAYQLINRAGYKDTIKANELVELLNNGKISVANLSVTPDNRIEMAGDNTGNNDTYKYDLRDGILNYAIISRFPTIESIDTLCIKAVQSDDFDNYLNRQIIKIKLFGGYGDYYKINSRVALLRLNNNIYFIVNAGRIEFPMQIGNLFHNWMTSSGYRLRNLNIPIKQLIFDVDHIDASKVTRTSELFSELHIEEIVGLEIFSNSHITDAGKMFKGAHINCIDMHYFNFGSLINAPQMFYECKTELLNLANRDFSNLLNGTNMLSGVQADVLDLSGVAFNDECFKFNIFSGSKINILNITNLRVNDKNIFRRQLNKIHMQKIIGLDTI